MQRLKVDDESIENMTIEELLRSLGIELSHGEERILLDKAPISAGAALKDIEWKHGSLLSVSIASSSDSLQRQKPKSADPPKFHPFPALAKDFARRHSRGRRRSYSDRLHTVEAQPHGPITRLILCDAATRQFHSQRSNDDTNNSYGILLGTYGRERKEPRGTHHRTSLSTLPSADEYCAVAKVHAIWRTTDEDPLEALQDPQSPWRALAEDLGLKPVGWIFAYPGDRSSDNRTDDDESDPVPIHAAEATLACRLQGTVMEQLSHGDSTDISYPGFCTAAMSAATGATEAFQLSDVAVQMVAEGVWKDSDETNPQVIRTDPPVLVDDRETSALEVVLCLMNTALLRHAGRYTIAKPISHKRGRLTKKGRKQLLKALDKQQPEGSPCTVLPLLADFHVLMAALPLLDDDEADRDELIGLVRKWAQGQKKSTRLSTSLAAKLRSAL